MRPDPTILAFDTSAAHCAAALLMNGQIVASRYEEMKRGQAERLMPMLDEVLAEADKDWNEIDAIGVGIGPGNFTGIRISVSTARGLALSLGIKAIGVSSFDAITYGISTPAIASVEAPREQVYAQVVNHQGAEPVLGTIGTIEIEVPARAEPICVGSGSDEFAKRFAGVVQEPRYPLTEAIAHTAARRMESSRERPSPLYIRPADAAPPSDPPPKILP